MPWTKNGACERGLIHHRREDTKHLIFILVLHDRISTGLEGLNSCLNVGSALLEGEAGCLELEGLCLPVLRLFCRLEGGIFTDSSVGIGIDFFHVLGANTVGKVS